MKITRLREPGLFRVVRYLPILLAASLFGEVRVHNVKPGDDPQAILDRANPGDRLVFLPGLHQHGLKKHRSLLYVDRSIDIELQAGATLKLADHVTRLEKSAEITTDHGAPKTYDDLSVGGDYDLGLGAAIYTIRIDSEGKGGAADTFTWGSGGTFDFQHSKVPITGQWQALSHGVQIKFERTSGHSLGSLWFLSYDGPEAYGIRIGHGTQASYIEGVRIFGKGTIDLNSRNNVEPSGLVKNINATILVHGRVRDVEIEGITMTNTMRSVMLYGEHTGQFLQGGATTPGESFDAGNISIHHTRTINPRGSGYLLGHPSHRGWLRKVRCNFNYMETATTSIEPNFQLDQYEVIGNVIKSGGRAVHCWRRSTNGVVAGNVRIDDVTGKEVVMVNAPGAWQNPENVVVRDNRNHLSDPAGHWANVSGGMNTIAKGAYSSVTGGRDSQAEADYSRAQGLQARARRAGEDALSAGAFREPGDAQTSVVTARALSANSEPAELRLAGDKPLEIMTSSSVVFKALIVGRTASGTQVAAFEIAGVANRNQGEVTVQARTDTLKDSAGFQVSAEGGDRLRLLARSAAGSEVRWVARVELAEVRY